MRGKHIAVALKYYKGELNPFDAAALECALTTGAAVTVLAMAPLSVLPALQTLTRLGVQAVLVSDAAYAGSDTVATSTVLAAAIRKLNPDLLFCGRQSVDGDTAQVPPMLAQLLGFDIYAKVMAYENGVFVLRSGERVVPRKNQVFTFERMASLRFPSVFSKAGEVQVWNNDFLGVPTHLCGLGGSPTRVVKTYESNVGRRKCRFITAEELPAVIAQSLQKERACVPQTGGEKLPQAYYAGDVAQVAAAVASHAVALDVHNKTPQQIADTVRASGIKTVLWQDSDQYKITAPQVAICLRAGLCADCISFRTERGKFVMTRPALGGSVTADIVCTSDIAMATVRTEQQSGDIVFAVGNGAVAHFGAIQEAAARYNAELCCSRIVADGGVLPYAAQVGLTGKKVSPKVYVAWGVSGAVQHTCAIEGAGTVIAVNKDKNARIFDYADFGVVGEVEHVKL